MLIAVLFTQLAVAAYSCPAAPAALADPAPMAVEMADCHGMGDSGDPAQPQLCKAHCSNEAQSAARPLLPDFQPNPAAVTALVRVIEPVMTAALADASRPPPVLVRSTASLPLYLTLHVLRN